MPNIAGYKMSYCTSHFDCNGVKWAVLEENRPIKTASETLLCHLIRNVSCLAWPVPRLQVTPASPGYTGYAGYQVTQVTKCLNGKDSGDSSVYFFSVAYF